MITIINFYYSNDPRDVSSTSCSFTKWLTGYINKLITIIRYYFPVMMILGVSSNYILIIVIIE